LTFFLIRLIRGGAVDEENSLGNLPFVCKFFPTDSIDAGARDSSGCVFYGLMSYQCHVFCDGISFRKFQKYKVREMVSGLPVGEATSMGIFRVSENSNLSLQPRPFYQSIFSPPLHHCVFSKQICEGLSAFGIPTIGVLGKCFGYGYSIA